MDRSAFLTLRSLPDETQVFTEPAMSMSSAGGEVILWAPDIPNINPNTSAIEMVPYYFRDRVHSDASFRVKPWIEFFFKRLFSVLATDTPRTLLALAITWLRLLTCRTFSPCSEHAQHHFYICPY